MFTRPLLLAFLFTPFLLSAEEQERFPEDSPEHQALTAAGPSLADEAFSLRQEYWEGVLTGRTGRAVRLQFFKHNVYGLFLGVAPSALPPGGRLDLRIYDSDNREVAKAIGEPDEAAVALLFDNDLGSGTYLVLMRVDFAPGPFPETGIPAALFYGWK